MGDIKERDELYFYFQKCVQHQENKYTKKTLQSAEEMERLAYYDALTGLKNRRAFEKDAKETAAEKDRFWIVSVDANNLKKANDTYGHQCGDGILKEIAASMKELFGENACYRFGGDEFAVILAEENKEKCLERIKELKNHLQSKKTAQVPVTIAAGAALCLDGKYIEALGEADREMYRDKEKCKARWKEEPYSSPAGGAGRFSVTYSVSGIVILYVLAVLAVIFLN